MILRHGIHGSRRPRILVLGDLMLDQYTWGDAERVSPEAPVLVLRADTDEQRCGGAGSVAALLRNLDAEVTLGGVVGDDQNGQTLISLLHRDGVNCDLVQLALDRPTTTKHRLLGRAPNRQPHQIVRVDRERRDPLLPQDADTLKCRVVERLADQDVLLISDYAKGVCTPLLLAQVIAAACKVNVPVAIDPAHITDYARYSRATLIKPNRREAEAATGKRISKPADAIMAGRQLCTKHRISSAFVTLDRDGIAVVDTAGGRLLTYIEPTRQREVCDITGAGDMVLATIGIGMAEKMPLDRIAKLANVAAGIEIRGLGVTPVRWCDIDTELANDESPAKLVTLDQMVSLSTQYRSCGKSIVFTNGCFDLLHAGHVQYLRDAAGMGDVLVVAINSDASVTRLKGIDRPLIGQKERVAMLGGLACVNHVLVFDDDVPHHLLRSIRPDVLVKGGTYALDEVVGREIVEEYGGRIRVTAATEGVSTSALVSRIRASIPASLENSVTMSNSTDNREHEDRLIGSRSKLPPRRQQFWNVAIALADFVADGCKTVTSEEYQQRLQICNDCQFRNRNRCLKCGCRLSLKARGRAFACPIGKWPAVSQLDVVSAAK